MGGVKSMLYYTFAWFVKKSCKIIKKIAHTQYARAKIYANYPFRSFFLRKLPSWCQSLHINKKTHPNAFFSTRVSVQRARSCRTDRYVSCRGRDRVCRMLLEPLPQLCPFAIFQQIHYFHLIVGKGFFGELVELIGVYRFHSVLLLFNIFSNE